MPLFHARVFKYLALRTCALWMLFPTSFPVCAHMGDFLRSAHKVRNCATRSTQLDCDVFLRTGIVPDADAEPEPSPVISHDAEAIKLSGKLVLRHLASQAILFTPLHIHCEQFLS